VSQTKVLGVPWTIRPFDDAPLDRYVPNPVPTPHKGGYYSSSARPHQCPDLTYPKITSGHPKVRDGLYGDASYKGLNSHNFHNLGANRNRTDSSFFQLCLCPPPLPPPPVMGDVDKHEFDNREGGVGEGQHVSMCCVRPREISRTTREMAQKKSFEN
jgi:hypothetical protein